MIGRTLGRFQISDKLGEGGMGVVYRAFDTRLNRTVALKVLPAAALADPDRKQRFVQEAIAASALNHPHIVTTYDIDRIEEVEFIAMEYVEGQSLDRVIAAGRLPIPQVIEYGSQLADALAAAHRAGIVHRDIKPANVIVTHGGQLKVLDFGLAKLAERESPPDAATITGVRATAAGTVVGTAAYMAPEQAEGKRVTPASDVFAIGIVLYELASGARPFHGKSELALLTSLLRDQPPPLTSVRPETPEELERIVTKCLAKDPAERFASAAELHDALSRLRIATTETPPRRDRWHMVTAAAVVAAFALGGLAWWALRNPRPVEADRDQLAEIEQLLETQRTVTAYSRFRTMKAALPRDPELLALEKRLVFPIPMTSDPPGALVEIQDYAAADSPWMSLGETPLDSLPLGSAYVRLRMTKAGFEPRVVGYSGVNLDTPLKLHATGTRPEGMIYVPGGRYQYGRTPMVDLSPYWMDQYEVTNAQFKAFVDAGGYRRRELWTHAFVRNGTAVTWEQAMAAFVDGTGRPGPATWELGSHPDGKGQEPVTGVSWYEASAYAAFAGKTLPSVYHWNRAAGFGPNAMASDIVRMSNFGGKSVAPVGSYRATGPFGTEDMAGNAKEWCSNERSGRRHIAGGAWSEPVYMFTDPDAQDPFDRQPTFGFRCIKPVEGAARAEGPLFEPIDTLLRDVTAEPKISDDAFAAYKAFYAYDKAPLNERIGGAETATWWRKETISYNAAYGGERVVAYLFLPLDAAPPYQTVIHIPGSYARVIPSSQDLSLAQPAFDFIVRSGRAVLFPVLKGTYERRFTAPPGPNQTRDLIVQWYKDVARSIDYLETRQDIDSGRLAFHGLSMGANEAPLFGALEPRFKTIISVAGGLFQTIRLPEAEPATFAPRVRMPFLMINGRQDFMRPYQTSQLPLYKLLGLPESQKRLAAYDGGGHLPPRLPMIKETLDWLDRYLGAVTMK